MIADLQAENVILRLKIDTLTWSLAELMGRRYRAKAGEFTLREPSKVVTPIGQRLYKPRRCGDCNGIFDPKHPAQRRCDECRSKHDY